MSEIPMPSSDGYETPPPTETKKSNTLKIVAIVIVIVVVIAGVVVVVLFRPFAPSGPTYSSRTVDSFSDVNIELWPTFYRDEFSVSSSETQTSTAPDLYFQINVQSTGSDSVDTTVYYEVYDISLSSFDSLSWSELVPYLVDYGSATNTVDNWIDLNNNADTYVWVLYFDATSKTSEWDVDITLTLRYNWES